MPNRVKEFILFLTLSIIQRKTEIHAKLHIELIPEKWGKGQNTKNSAELVGI